jgi:hypothetical protein
MRYQKRQGNKHPLSLLLAKAGFLGATLVVASVLCPRILFFTFIKGWDGDFAMVQCIDILHWKLRNLPDMMYI